MQRVVFAPSTLREHTPGVFMHCKLVNASHRPLCCTVVIVLATCHRRRARGRAEIHTQTLAEIQSPLGLTRRRRLDPEAGL